jgi:hypothetical protein
MKKKYVSVAFFLFMLLALSPPVAAANAWIGWYSSQWERDSGAGAMIQTTDGGYAVIGSANSCPNSPYCSYGYITKLTVSGEVAWSHIFGLDSNPSTYFHDVTEMSDGSIVVIGDTGTDQIGVVDVLIAKFSSNGTLIWQNVYGAIGLDGYGPHKIYANPDGSLSAMSVISGGNKNIYHLLIDGASGALLNEIKLSGSGYASGYKGFKVSDGFIALPPSFYGNGINKYTITPQKFDANGNLEWSRSILLKMKAMNSSNSVIIAERNVRTVLFSALWDMGVNTMYLCSTTPGLFSGSRKYPFMEMLPIGRLLR